MSTGNITTTLQVAAQGMTYAMVVSVFANAMGMMLAAAPVMPLAAGVAVPDAGIADLRQAFGSDIVNRAIKNVGRDDIITLAHEVERLVVAQMKKQYGDVNTKAALNAAPPGELSFAREIAKSLSGLPSQVRVVTLKAMEDPVAPRTAQTQQTVDRVVKKGRQAAQPVKDTKTGAVYHSKASAGMAVAPEYGLSATKPDGTKNSFVWYEVIKKDPKRFVKA